jgi:Tol biopolymer transport system component
VTASTGPAPASSPQVYRSASRLVYEAYDRSVDSFKIFMAKDDGSELVRLTDGDSTDMGPRLKRGGDIVAFASDRNGNFEIYTIKANATGLVALTSNSKDDVNPAWSRDGTRIAFQSYRDGHSEVYVMNADGSGQTRLTWDSSGYNGEPTWSPDGTKIAFTSYRNNAWRIWVMNANGSGQVQLSQQAYSENPAWSPDGTQIAYDADSDNDNWQEIWLMGTDGSNQRQIYKPNPNNNCFTRSWSPDGQLVAFTYVSYINYDGKWYWTSAFLNAINIDTTWWVARIGSGLEDWDPDWQTLDVTPPSSAVRPFPDLSPGPIPVQWTGSDSGAGLQHYDIQVREGAGGSWKDWLTKTTQMSGAYPGQGGKTYSFRSRAVDNALNQEAWPANPDATTTVESLPPVSSVNPVPRGTRSTVTLTLTWQGRDLGGSGIQSYELEAWDGATTTPISTNGSNAYFSGTSGKTYWFRIRAVDHAGNLEPWPAEYDTLTTFYDYAYSGTVYDNRETSLDGASIQINPDTGAADPAEGSGRYHVYLPFYPAQAPVTITWSLPGTQDLPGTRLASNADLVHQVYFTPANNLVMDWGFESGSPDTNGWQKSGDSGITTHMTHTHSGLYAGQLGHEEPKFTEPSVAIPEIGRSPQVLIAPDGEMHLLWMATQEKDGVFTSFLSYASYDRASDTWSTPQAISGGSVAIQDEHKMAFDSSGNLMVVWADQLMIEGVVRFRQRSSDGTWGEITTLSTAGHRPSSLKLVVDNAGAAHILWMETYGVYSNYTRNLNYIRRSANGVLETTRNIGVISDSDTPQLAVDGLGRTHLVWMDTETGLNYQYRSVGGGWSAISNRG